MDGRLLDGGRELHAGQTGWSDPISTGEGGTATTSLPLTAVDPERRTRVMVYSGTPLREPVALGGPFLVNTEAEITKAFTGEAVKGPGVVLVENGVIRDVDFTEPCRRISPR